MKRDWWNKEFKILMTLGESITAGGWSSCRERCWAAQLTRLINELQRVPLQLINVGIGANVISTKSAGYQYSGKPAASERLEKHVLSHYANGNLLLPDLLVISYGSNDARSGTPIDLFCSEMKDLIRRVRETNVTPLEGAAIDGKTDDLARRVRERIRPLIVLVGPYYIIDFKLGGDVWSHGSLEIFHKYNDAIRLVALECECLFVDIMAAFGEADWMVHRDGVHSNDLGHRIVANKIFEVLASNCSGLAQETQELEKYIEPWRDESTLQE
jgi:lysophospholipase L1-like esterase